MSEDNDSTEPPKSSLGNHLHKFGSIVTPVTGSIISSLTGIPGIADALGAIYSVITPPLEKRRAEWMLSVHTKLVNLQSTVDGFTFKDLSNKPFFIDTFIRAYQIALRTHQEEKLQALTNAVVNSAMPAFPEDDLYMMFINWIDNFTPWHIKILSFVNDLEPRQPGKIIDMVCNNFPELKNESLFAIQIIRELIDHGLIYETGERDIRGDEVSVIPPSISPIGKKFLKFISTET